MIPEDDCAPPGLARGRGPLRPGRHRDGRRPAPGSPGGGGRERRPLAPCCLRPRRSLPRPVPVPTAPTQGDELEDATNKAAAKLDAATARALENPIVKQLALAAAEKDLVRRRVVTNVHGGKRKELSMWDAEGVTGATGAAATGMTGAGTGAATVARWGHGAYGAGSETQAAYYLKDSPKCSFNGDHHMEGDRCLCREGHLGKACQYKASGAFPASMEALRLSMHPWHANMACGAKGMARTQVPHAESTAWRAACRAPTVGTMIQSVVCVTRDGQGRTAAFRPHRARCTVRRAVRPVPRQAARRAARRAVRRAAR